MTTSYEDQRAKIRRLIDKLTKEFESVEGIEYKIIVESYDDRDDHFVGAEESNNWERSWC